MRCGSVLLMFVVLAPIDLVAEDPSSAPKEFYKVLPRKGTRIRRPARQAPLPERTAAPESGAQPNIDTTIHVELLTGTEGVGLIAQEWEQVFERENCAVRIRRGLPTDRVEIREKTIGRLRTIDIVGKLERNGDLVFDGRAFKRSSAEAVAEWIRELKTYGAQGSPEGKPMWGLSKAQFQDLYASLAPVVEVETKGQPLDTVIERLALPAKYPLGQMLSARNRLAAAGFTPAVGVEAKGYSKGTALAMILASYGLGFRPQRTPNASIELAVESLEKTQDVWPVGWNVPAGTPPRDVAPTLYQLVTVEFDEQSLAQVLQSISAECGLPVAIDEAKIRSKGIKLEELRVKHPQKQTSYDLVLNRVTAPRLMYRLRIDEAQRPFVWITPLEAGKPLR